MNKWSLCQGVTLVELMISLTLGLIISASAVQMHVSQRVSQNLQRALSSIQEQGRYGQDLLSTQMKLSGYGGERGAIKSFLFNFE